MQTRHPLDDVYMSEHERARAKAHMQSAEAVIDLVVWGASKLRSVFGALTTYYRSAITPLFRQRAMRELQR